MYMAKWGPKGFLVSPEKIVTFDGFSTSVSLKSDNGTDTSGTSPTNTKGREPQTVSLSINYARIAGVDPRAQFDEWSSLVGKAYPLYIGDVIFGPDLLMLTKVDLSDLRLSPDGSFINAKVAVSFDEYTPPQTSGNGSTIAVANARKQQAKAAADEKKQFLKENNLTGDDVAAALAAKPYEPKEKESAGNPKGLPYIYIAPGVVVDDWRGT